MTVRRVPLSPAEAFARRPLADHLLLPERTAETIAFPTQLLGVPSGLGLNKFRDELPLPRVIQLWRRREDTPVTIRAELARVRFHADLPEVIGWTFEGTSPGPILEVKRDKSARVDWANDLSDTGTDANLPFAAVGVPSATVALTPGGRSTDVRDGPASFSPLPHAADLTACTATHVHGALTDGHSDGSPLNVLTPGGLARCVYPNRQPAAALWYRDQAMGVSRFNGYAGLFGLYLIRDQIESQLRLPSGDLEIPLVLADRNLETDGDALPAEPRRFTGRLLAKQAGEAPLGGPFMLVNGRIWPKHRVPGRWHRLRLVNASNGRILRLGLHDTTEEQFTPGVAVPSTDPAFAARRLHDALIVIGTDGGLLAAPYVTADGTVELGPGERLDVLVDFGAHTGRTLELRNEHRTALNAQPGQADATVLQFAVDPEPFPDPWELPAAPEGTAIEWARFAPKPRQVWVGILPGTDGRQELVELRPLDADSADAGTAIRITYPDGTALALRPVARPPFGDDPGLEIPRGEWVIWHLLHFGGPDQSIHIRGAGLQMIERVQWPVANDVVVGFAGGSLGTPTPGAPLDPIVASVKDTWVVRPGEWVSLFGQFDSGSGRFACHSQILDDADRGMSLPFAVVPAAVLQLRALRR